jgi:hypothetical protein
MSLILKQEFLYTIEFNRKLNELQLLSDNSELVSSRIDSLKLKQQRLFSKLLFKMYDEFNSNGKTVVSNDIRNYLDKSDLDMDADDFEDDLGVGMTLNRVNLLMGAEADEEGRMKRMMYSDQSFKRIEESYTIQLGAQLKTTHNLRLIRFFYFFLIKVGFELRAFSKK